MSPDAPTRALRRGLPRIPGAEPWPPAGDVPADPVARAASETAEVTAPPATEPPARALVGAPPVPAGGGGALRRGLPRSAGGDAWPPAGTSSVTPAPLPSASDAPAPTVAATEEPETASGESDATPAEHETAPAPAPAVPTTEPARATPTASASGPAAAPAAFARLRGLSRAAQAALGLVALVVVAAVIVLAARGLTTYPVVQDFLATYPGEYHLPDTVDPGFPAWVRWTHFLNAFFIILIIRSGWQVRTQQRPPAMWTPRWGKNPKKISLNLWFHQLLDILWLLNGVVFVVLLFVTGRWLRIVPSSWEVFPNALSALLQYLTLQWPVENGWVNYNGLQQIMYFITVFVAAPLAALTGVRMSGIWPARAKRLSELYPIEVARAIHFPVMLYFVGFVIVHVFLVLATGALRNLNHMYAGTDDVNWIGFGLFAASLAVMAAAWIAARPVVLAPIASLFGRVGR